jgi:hypothetical protein
VVGTELHWGTVNSPPLLSVLGSRGRRVLAMSELAFSASSAKRDPLDLTGR